MLKNAKEIGPFYSSQHLYNSSLATTLFMVLGLIEFGMIIFRKRRKKINGMMSEFNPLEVDMLQRFLATDPLENEIISVIQINEILNIDKKTPENQRRMRTKFIKDLNVNLLANFQVYETIEQPPSNEDKTLVLYRLKEDIKNKLVQSGLKLH